MNSSPLPRLVASWSSAYLGPGDNPGYLDLSLSNENECVSLATGDTIALLNLPQGWSLKTCDPRWQVSGGALVWNGGADSFSVLCLPARKLSIIISAPPQLAAPTLTLQVQLTKASGQALTQPYPVAFSLTASSNPVTAFAFGSAEVILTASGAVACRNRLDCALMSSIQPSGSPPQVTVKLQLFKASSQVPVAPSPQLEVRSPIATFTAGSDGWTATTPAWAPGEANALAVALDGLALHDEDEGLVELRFTISDLLDQPYQTSAWFETAGPYSIQLALAQEAPGAHRYRQSADGMTITAAPGHACPPVIVSLLKDGQSVLCPVPSDFSWNTGSINYPIYDYPAGPSSLYLLDAGNLERCITSFQLTMEIPTSASPAPLDFHGMDLRGVDFSNWTNLRGANLKGARLDQTNFQGADLAGADFTEAAIGEINLSGAILTGAVFSSGADLSNASLVGVASGGIAAAASLQLPSGILAANGYFLGPGANLQGAQLAGAHLVKANLSGANLTNANLQNARMTKACLTKANLTGADFSGAFLAGVVSGGITGTCTPPANWVLWNGYLLGWLADLTGVDLSSAPLTAVSNGHLNVLFLVGNPLAIPSGWKGSVFGTGQTVLTSSGLFGPCPAALESSPIYVTGIPNKIPWPSHMNFSW